MSGEVSCSFPGFFLVVVCCMVIAPSKSQCKVHCLHFLWVVLVLVTIRHSGLFISIHYILFWDMSP